MPNHIVKRGKAGVWYAKRRLKGVQIQDCLSTTDERIARRRLAELEHAVERGDYHSYKKTFLSAAEEFLKTATLEERSMALNHLIPYFSRFRIGEITEYEVYKWFETVNLRPESTLKKWLRCLRKIVCLGNRQFELPKLAFPNKGKKFDATQILEEWEVLRIIQEFVAEKYRIPCLISAYSALRLGNVISTKKNGVSTPGLRKADVDLKRGHIRTRQVKTFLPVYIPMSDKIREVFAQIKVWPLNDQDEFFPHLNGKAATTAVIRAVKKAGYERGGFHLFRHFAACFMINSDPPVPLEVVQQIMGHEDIKSTQVYAQIKPATLRKAVKVFDQGMK